MFHPIWPGVRNVVVLIFLSLSASATWAAPGDWPQWRGPNRDGISTETGLLQEWPAGGPPLAWKITNVDRGFSSVAVAAEKIYTMGDAEDASYIYALDLNGKRVWSAKLGKTGERGGYFGPRATPTVAGNLVYGLGQFGDLVCVEAATGTERWRKNLKKDFEGNVGGWGYSESPLVDGTRVICSPGGKKGTVVALHTQSGELIWRSDKFTDSAEYSSPIAVDLFGVRQYIQLTGESVAGVAAANGQLVWRAPRQGSTAVIPTPIFSEQHVYVTSGYGIGCNLFALQKMGSVVQASEVYANKVMVNHHGGVILYKGHVYGYSDGKGWTCQNFKTGQMIWSEKKLDKGALVYADNRFYLRSESGKGTMALIEATTTGYVEKGRFDQPNRSDQHSWPHPVVVGGKLYVRDQNVLLCYNVKQ